MINVRRYGREPHRVAVIHGGPGAPGSVAAMARELSRDFGVLEPLQTRSSLEGQVLELREELENHGALPVTLIGHSWGAWLAFILAARYPQMVSKLILVGSGPFEQRYVQFLKENRLSRLDPQERTEFQQLLQQLGSPDAMAKDQLLSRLGNLVSKSDNFDLVVIPTDEQDLVQVDGDLYQAVWAEAAELRRSGALLANAPSITCPIVAIHGDCDPHPASGVKEPLEQAGRDFRFLLLRQCGHTPWKERYAMDEFYAIVRHEIVATNSAV